MEDYGNLIFEVICVITVIVYASYFLRNILRHLLRRHTIDVKVPKPVVYKTLLPMKLLQIYRYDLRFKINDKKQRLIVTTTYPLYDTVQIRYEDDNGKLHFDRNIGRNKLLLGRVLLPIPLATYAFTFVVSISTADVSFFDTLVLYYYFVFAIVLFSAIVPYRVVARVRDILARKFANYAVSATVHGHIKGLTYVSYKVDDDYYFAYVPGRFRNQVNLICNKDFPSIWYVDCTFAGVYRIKPLTWILMILVTAIAVAMTVVIFNTFL